jgi:ribosomal protein S12 methylthiotransferase accessory factor
MRAAPSSDIPPQWWPFVGPKLGLVKSLSYLADDPEDFGLFHVIPSLTGLGRLLDDTRRFEPRAGGAGLRLEEACNRAMGELLERYASLAYNGERRVVASHRELCSRGDRVVPMAALRLYSGNQLLSEIFPFNEFTNDTRVGWFEGTDLRDGSPIYVPGQQVSLGYRPGSDEAANCFYSTSSGCALATSVEAAVLAGLLECIERDAFIIRWYARMAPPLLDCDPADLLGRPLSPRSDGLEIRIHDLTVDGSVPVAAATCIERSDRSCFFALGSAAHLNMRIAGRKALFEVGQGRPFVKSLASFGEAPARESRFSNFDSNVRFFAEPANAQYVEWFAANRTISRRGCPISDDARSPSALLHDLLDRCSAMGLTPVAFDITTPELADQGFYAAKVIIPELVPLCVSSAPFLGHPRLARFLAASGDDHAAACIPAWVPHPFP